MRAIAVAGLFVAVGAAIVVLAVRTPTGPASDATPEAVPVASLDAAPLASLVRGSCLDCHDANQPEAGVDLTAVAHDPLAAPAGLVRRVRDRLFHRDMPPGDDPDGRPSLAEYAGGVRLAEEVLDLRAANAAAGAPTLRRLNRVEYRNTVRDLLGVDLDVEESLPADDVGEGFDSIGAVLSLSPIALEKYLDLAERAAERAYPPAVARSVTRIEGKDLAVGGAGQAGRDGALVWSNGAATRRVEIPRAGRYRVRFGAYGMQAGADPVRCAVVAGRRTVAEFDLSETAEAPGERSSDTALPAGQLTLGVAFLNDFVDKNGPQGRRDRNLVVRFLELDGPLDDAPPTAEVAAFDQSGELADFARALASSAFRRPADDATVARLLAAVPEGAAPDEARRALLVRCLVDSRFLFRIEEDPAASEADRPLDGFEIAARLSYFLWASMPDAELFAAAANGDLDSAEGVRRSAERLLRSPRSIALAERFGRQWLHVAGLERRQPDPTLMPGLAPAEIESLLGDLDGETTLFLDALLREGLPIGTLLDADWTFLNERLARHYGLAGVVGGLDGGYLRRVDLRGARPPGLFGHGSVLLATSNPSRTSPVKRGKWVLESLLDSPPPPPPPGVPALPERRAAGDRETAREQLARHRADPNCAGCHVRMDQIGLAFESLDPVGRRRAADGDASLDTAGRLPDGRAFDGPESLARIVRDDPAFRRSLVKHLFVFALGRSLAHDDEATVDRLARRLPADASLRDLVLAIVSTDQFRRRSAPPREITS